MEKVSEIYQGISPLFTAEITAFLQGNWPFKSADVMLETYRWITSRLQDLGLPEDQLGVLLAQMDEARQNYQARES